MDLSEKKVKSTQLFDGKIVKLYKDDIELPNGMPAIREVIRHPGAVCVVPVTDDGNVILVRQFRYPFDRLFLEIPAGKLDGKNEDPEKAALRELSEETGAKIKGELEFLGVYTSSPAILDEKIYMYLARGIEGFFEKHPDEDEFVETVIMPLDELVEMINEGKIEDGKTQTAVLKAYMRINK